MKYILISVYEREISTKQFETLEDAQAEMLSELEVYGGIETPVLNTTSEYDEWQIDTLSAWSNVDEDNKQDWLIVEVD